MKVVYACPNGSCLFISLRLALEVLTILDMHKIGPIESACVDGFDDRVLESSEKLRHKIISWYSGDNASKEVPSMGNFVEAHNSVGAVPWTRTAIIATEISRTHKECDAESIRGYLRHMMRRSSWGSSPEYMAFAFMAKLNVEVWQPGPTKELSCIDKVCVPEAKGTIKLLYNGSSHYDLLLDDGTAIDLRLAWPASVISDLK